jgi:spore germination protein YaaH
MDDIRRRQILWPLIALFAIVALAIAASPGARRPAFVFRPQVVGFYVDEAGPTGSLGSLRDHARDLNVVAPLWHSIYPDGSVDDKVNREALEIARRARLQILPLVNVGKNDDTFLRDPAARDRAITGIIRHVRRYDYAGVFLDIQLLPEDGRTFTGDRDLLTDFVRRLRNRLKAERKTLAMAVIPQFDTSPDISAIYDYGALARLVDRVALMTYDRHQASSPPGPVAPFGWVEGNIKDALKKGFRASQILLGIATYGYDWPAGQAGGFSRPTSQIMERAGRFGVQVKWDDRSQEPYYAYTAPGDRPREVWFENKATLKQKISLVRKYRLAGLAVWRLGFEEDDFWRTLREGLRRPPAR